jgi:hypothetical protein
MNLSTADLRTDTENGFLEYFSLSESIVLVHGYILITVILVMLQFISYFIIIYNV